MLGPLSVGSTEYLEMKIPILEFTLLVIKSSFSRLILEIFTLFIDFVTHIRTVGFIHNLPSKFKFLP